MKVYSTLSASKSFHDTQGQQQLGKYVRLTHLGANFKITNHLSVSFALPEKKGRVAVCAAEAEGICSEAPGSAAALKCANKEESPADAAAALAWLAIIASKPFWASAGFCSMPLGGSATPFAVSRGGANWTGADSAWLPTLRARIADMQELTVTIPTRKPLHWLHNISQLT